MNMKIKFYMYSILALSTLIAFDTNARSFGSGFGWGMFTGCATSFLTSKMAQCHQPPAPVVVYREPVYVSQAVPQPVVKKQVRYVQIPKPNNDSQDLEIIRERKELLKEENRKKELELEAKRLELESLKIKK